MGDENSPNTDSPNTLYGKQKAPSELPAYLGRKPSACALTSQPGAAGWAGVWAVRVLRVVLRSQLRSCPGLCVKDAKASGQRPAAPL